MIYCNTLQHTAIYHTFIPHDSWPLLIIAFHDSLQRAVTRNTLQHSATRCNTLQHAATHYSLIPHGSWPLIIIVSQHTGYSSWTHTHTRTHTHRHTSLFPGTPCIHLCTHTHTNTMPRQILLIQPHFGFVNVHHTATNCNTMTRRNATQHTVTYFDRVVWFS